MKKSWPALLVLGLFLGMLVATPWVFSGPIQQQTGENQWDYITDRWINVCNALSSADGVIITGGTGSGWTSGECGMPETQSFVSIFNPATGPDAWDRLRVASGDGLAGTGILGAGQLAFNGTTWDRMRAVPTTDTLSAVGIAASGNMVFNQNTTQWERMRATGETGGTRGIPFVRVTASNGAISVGLGSVSATNLTNTTSNEALLTTPLSTWSVTNTPAAATQATASRAAGAAGVRHVATTVTACLAAGGTAQTPILAHLRDGATGAGTILRSWAFSAPVNTSKCDNISGLAMIGTAATAMTIEFTGAGVASSQQTVTLTGFSVP